MQEGADSKQNPSPTRVCLDLLASQIDEMDRRQASDEGRQRRFESENARVLTQLVQRIERLSQDVSDVASGSGFEETIQLELTRLFGEQAENRALLKNLQQATLSPTDPAVLEIKHRLDRALEDLARLGQELELIRQLPFQTTSSAGDAEDGGRLSMEVLAAQQQVKLELTRLQQGQQELRQALQNNETPEAKLDETVIVAMEQRLAGRFDDIQQAIVDAAVAQSTTSAIPQLQDSVESRFSEIQQAIGELTSIKQVVASDEEGGDHGAIQQVALELLAANKTLSSDLESVHREQAELKSLLENLNVSRGESREFDSSELNARMNETFELLRDTRSEIEALKEQQSQQASSTEESSSAPPAELLEALERLSNQVGHVESERDELRTQLEARDESQHQDSAANEALQQELRRTQDELESVRGELAEAAKAGGGASEALVIEFSKLEKERDELKAQVDFLEEQGHDRGGSDEVHQQLRDALEELEKTKKKLEKARQSGGETASAAGAEDGWEAQKRALLAQLENEDDESDDEERQNEVLSMQQVIDATDSALSEKESEIEDLKQLLEQQSENIGGVAIGAAAIEGILNDDEIIQQERESLERMKQEWREKLSKAEIEVSMERAKIARERKELEAEIESLKDAQKKMSSDDDDGSGDDSSSKSRWFARLGLEDK